MGAYKLIVYPFVLAVAAMAIVTVVAFALFGTQPASWSFWQNEITNAVGSVLGLIGLILGLWLSVRNDENKFN
jgi:hypothetical protein